MCTTVPPDVFSTPVLCTCTNFCTNYRRGVHSNEPMKPDVQDQMFEFESMWIDGQIQKTDTRFSQAELSKVLSHLAVKSYRVLVYIPPTTPMGKHTTSLIDLNQQVLYLLIAKLLYYTHGCICIRRTSTIDE